MTKKTKRVKKKIFKNEIMNRQIRAVIILTFAVFVFACIRFTPQTGYTGIILNNFFRILVGDAALALPFMLGVIGLCHLWPLEIDNLHYRFVGLFIIFCLLAISLHLILTLQEWDILVRGDFYSSILYLGIQQQGGGLLGAVLTAALLFLFKDIGSYIVISALGLVALLLITNSSIIEIFKSFLSGFKSLAKLSSSFSKTLIGISPPDVLKKEIPGGNYTIKEYNNFEVSPDTNEEKKEEKVEKDEKDLYKREVFENNIVVASKEINERNTLNEGHSDEYPKLTNIIQENKPSKDYKIPPTNLLIKVNKLRDFQQQKVIQERARALESTFKSFGVNVTIKEVQAGPAVTRFEIQPDKGVKVSKILSLSDDLALNLAAPDVRIEAPIPGKAAIGIEVPNKIISLVYLREVLDDPAFKSTPSPLTIGLGKDIAGAPIFADLLKMPHLLIAGSTGSGKSVCINTVISSILFKATPWVVKFLLIDPKIVELSIYNGIPHLISPVITEPKKASMALRSMVKEMERRYELFAHKGVRDISRYNEHVTSNASDNYNDNITDNPLPYIVVVIDELADLMMVASSEVEDSIVRLSQMSRAAGIHLVIATQRPSVDIITGLIKANITSRIAFAVSSQIDSRTILDLGGAEKLLGRGDMLYYPIGVHKPLRVQGTFLSERDIFTLVEFIKQQESPLYQQSFFTEETSEEYIEEEKSDPLLQEAVELIIQTGHASISLIQRRYRIGYTRAARLIDDLERMGVVGKYEGSKPRKVLMGTEQVNALLKEKIKKIEI